MKLNRKFRLISCVIVFLTLILGLGYSQARRQAIDFSAEDIDGNIFSLHEHRGQVVLLDFMATWCRPCGQQILYLKEIAEKYSADEVILVSISIDPDYDTVGQLQVYRQNKGITWTVIRDTMRISNQYRVGPIPTLVLIDREGMIDATHIGLTDAETLSSEIDALLGRARPTSYPAFDSISLIAAFGAGVLSFASPCTLPLLPPFLAYVVGLKGGRLKGFTLGLAYTLGLNLTFTLLGISVGAVGSAIPTTLRYYSEIAGGLLLIIFGSILIILSTRPLACPIKLQKFLHYGGVIGLFTLGLVFGLIWIPCVTPILASILTYVVIKANVLYGGALLFAYSLGMGIPFILASVFLTEIKASLIQRILRLWIWIERASAVIMIAIGITMLL